MNYKDFCKKYESINSSIVFTDETLKKLITEMHSLIQDDDIEFTIVTTGSFGRKEASLESDLDLFIFCEKESSIEVLLKKKDDIDSCIKKYISKDAGDTGTFGSGAIVAFETILKNIGGNEDTNKLLTRRMLFLLEGKAIYNESLFNRYKRTLISKYLKSTSEGKIDKYLLNDIIRYYRTITTDFQHKIDSDEKSWGIRNIKLRFSRKLLYFAGILAIGYAADKESDTDKRINLLSSLFDTPPLERIYYLYTEKKGFDDLGLINKIFSEYETFLGCICNREKREELERIRKKEDRRDTNLYIELGNENIDFTNNLYTLLREFFDTNHPLHIALIF